MIYEEVTFEKNFRVDEFLFEKAIIKGRLEPGETVAEALTAAKVEAIDWFMKNTGQYTVTPDNRAIVEPIFPISSTMPVIQADAKDLGSLPKIKEEILATTDLEALKTYRYQASLSPTLQAAYDLKLKELTTTDKQSQ